MTDSELLQLIRQSQIFRGLDEATAKEAFQRSHQRSIAAGGAFIHQGDPALVFHILTQGHVKLVQVTPGGHEILTRFVKPGQEFGVISVLSGFENAMSAQAIDDCRALVWAGEVMAQLIERHTRIAFNAIRVLALRNLNMQRRYQELLTESVEQRLAQAVLNLLPTMGSEVDNGTLIDMPLTEEDLAELTGTTIYSVSRILNKWERAGIVVARRKRIVVCCPQALRSITTP